MSHRHRGFFILFLFAMLALMVLGAWLAMVEYLMPYSRAKAILDAYSYSGEVEFFTQNYYSGVVARSRFVGWILLSSSVGISFAWRSIIEFFLVSIHNLKREWMEIRDWLTEAEPDWAGYRWLFWGSIIAGISIRLAYLSQPVAADEATTFISFASRPLPILLSDWSAPNNQILHTICVRLFYLAFGRNLIALRMPAFLAGVIFLPIVYCFGKKFYSKSVGLLLLTYCSVAFPYVVYSTMGRGYTMLFCFSYILFLTCQFILHHQQNRMGWLIALLSSVAGFFTIPTMFYSFSGAMLWLAFSRSEDIISDRIVWWGKLTLFSLLVGIGVAFVYTPAYIATDWTIIVKDDTLVGGKAWIHLQHELEQLGPSLLSMLIFSPPLVSIVIWCIGISGSIALYRKQSCSLPLWVMVGVISFCIPIFLQKTVPYARVYYVFFPLVYAMNFSGLTFWTGRFCSVQIERWGIVFCCLLVGGFIGFGLLHDSPNFRFQTGDQFASAEEVVRYLASEGDDEDFYISMAPAVGPMVYYSNIYNFRPKILDLLDVIPQFQEGEQVAWIVVKKDHSCSVEQYFQALNQPEYTGRAKRVYSDEEGCVYRIDRVGLRELRERWQYPFLEHITNEMP